jgi:hypothetical protein
MPILYAPYLLLTTDSANQRKPWINPIAVITTAIHSNGPITKQLVCGDSIPITHTRRRQSAETLDQSHSSYHDRHLFKRTNNKAGGLWRFSRGWFLLELSNFFCMFCYKAYRQNTVVPVQETVVDNSNGLSNF